MRVDELLAAEHEADDGLDREQVARPTRKLPC